MPSGLPTAPDSEIGLQPPPVFAPKPGRPGVPAAPVIGDSPVIFNPIIIILIGYLEEVSPNGLQTAVANAREKLPDFMDKLNITDARSFLEFANDLLKWIPHENYEGKDIYDILCMFLSLARSH
ncbi:hypothetical protein JDV02_004602 [Purpureocillium takamizusanense]|uniref:Uncharacterized protein n=1 Tax=Purpureocillium takamizusanense TaxID=2060973 RepID=A0A9Q8QF15_9HYPO|nr:uncharacterized protein JDV02_004602 [Purpureocillium takamizusanense]UNI18328.1 hypothetical protein JDV02_004602 [Purpureocillium takamizusanense]